MGALCSWTRSPPNGRVILLDDADDGPTRVPSQARQRRWQDAIASLSPVAIHRVDVGYCLGGFVARSSHLATPHRPAHRPASYRSARGPPDRRPDRGHQPCGEQRRQRHQGSSPQLLRGHRNQQFFGRQYVQKAFARTEGRTGPTARRSRADSTTRSSSGASLTWPSSTVSPGSPIRPWSPTAPTT